MSKRLRKFIESELTKENLGYELRIGNKYNYFEYKDDTPYPCELINIIHDGYYVIYEFKHEEITDESTELLTITKNRTTIGSTIYPEKLKPLKI
jgi:hypothetical protein